MNAIRLTASIVFVNEKGIHRVEGAPHPFGLILPREHHGFRVMPTARTLLKGLIIENSAEGFRHLLTQVRFYMDREGLGRVVFGLEPTASTTTAGGASSSNRAISWSIRPTRRSRRTEA